MPTESKSETPRTDAMQRIQFEGCECVVASPEYMEGIEKELNEAKRDADNCRQIIETYSKQEGDLVQLDKENKVMRKALEKVESCPLCPDRGWLVSGAEESEQEQCQFCYGNPNSKFNLLNEALKTNSP